MFPLIIQISPLDELSPASSHAVHDLTTATAQLMSALMNVRVCRYVTVLVELTRIEGTKHGRLIAAQMLDVAIRVQAVRAFVVAQMVRNKAIF